MTSSRARLRQRQQQRQLLNAPRLDFTRDETVAHPPAPPVPLRTDWPALTRSRHPTWWQVHRVELRDGVRTFVLIAECQTERGAFEVAAHQDAQVRITKWESREAPYFSLREPKVVA